MGQCGLQLLGVLHVRVRAGLPSRGSVGTGCPDQEVKSLLVPPFETQTGTGLFTPDVPVGTWERE